MDLAPYLIPKTLDQGPRVLFLPLDDAFAFVIGAGVGFWLHNMGSAVVGGVLITLAYRRSKGREEANIVNNATVWYYPAWLAKLSVTPTGEFRDFS